MKQKLIQINTVCNTSTGRIMRDIQRKAQEEGFATLSCVGRRKVYRELPCRKYGFFFLSGFMWRLIRFLTGRATAPILQLESW